MEAIVHETPPYFQVGLQSEVQLGSMLSLQLAAVWPYERPTLEAFLIQQGERCRILDVGCGQGAWAVRVAEEFGNVEVTGVDLEESNIAAAQQAGECSSAKKKLCFRQANAFKLAEALGVGQFDFVASRSMLYTIPTPERVVLQILRALNPNGGVAHFLCEDYGSVLAYPTRLDNARFWANGPCVALRSQDCNPHMGRSIYAVAHEAVRTLGLRASITIEHLPISTAPPSWMEADETLEREKLARIFGSWKDYAGFIAENSDLTAEQASDHFDDIAAACRNPTAYVLWLCTICQVRLQGMVSE